MISTTGGKGAGYARNRGVEIARAPLLLFLDADDVLTERALEEMVISWGLYEEIIYSNYAGKAFMAQESLSNYDKRDILYYDSKTQLAVIRHHAAEFDCEQAVREPSRKLYIWNLITSLVPKAWHNEIGGFDESMISWEDWDYWIRMAQAGKCFHKLDKDLVVYRFYTGTRREDGLNEHQSLIKYMREKYDRTKPKESAMMSPPCGGGCGGKKKITTQTSPPRVSAVPRQIITKQNREVNTTMLNPQKVQDDEFVLCVYASRNLGQHKVIGMAEPRINYGQRKGGDKFYVRRRDIALQPHLFKVIEDVIKVPESQPSAIPEAPQLIEAPKPPPPSPHVIENVITDLQGVPGITPAIRAQLNASGVHTVDDLLCAGVGGLVELKGVGEKRAETIINFARQYIEKHAEKPEEKGDEDA